MQKVIELEEPTIETGFVPLHVDYGTTVQGSFVVPGEVTFDEERQITLVDGVPLIETDTVVRMAITSSDITSDGQQGATDKGVADDATPNA